MDSGNPGELNISKTWVGQRLEHDRQLYRVAFSSCGHYVLAAGQDTKLICWHLDDGNKKEFSGHTSWVGGFAFHPDALWVYSGDYHGSLVCRDVAGNGADPRWVQTAAHPGENGAPGWIRSVCVSGDGALVVTAGSDRVIRLWSSEDGTLQRELIGHRGDIFSTQVHPDGMTLVSGDVLGQVIQWELATGERVRTFDAGILHTREDRFLADVGGVRCLAFNRDGSRLVCGGMTDIKGNTFCPGYPAVLEFDFHSGQLVRTLRAAKKVLDDGPVQGVRVLEDGTVVSQGEHLHAQSTLEFWSTEGETSVHSLPVPSGYDLALHPDGRRLAVPVYKANGRSGNGRHAKPEEYLPHKAEVVVYHLYAPPEKPVAEKASG